MSLGFARGRPTNPARDTSRPKCWKSQHFGRLVSLGLEVRPPFPKGRVLEQGESSLLDPVRARNPFWRPVSQGRMP